MNKIIALRSHEESDDGWFYMYYEVSENFNLDVDKFEKDFSEVYDGDWRSAFDEVAIKYGLNKEIEIEVFDLTI